MVVLAFVPQVWCLEVDLEVDGLQGVPLQVLE